MAKSKLGPDEEAELDRVNQLATVAARRAAEALRGLLPDVLVDIFACDIGDVLVSHPLVFETFAAESVDWAHPHLTPDEESEGHLLAEWPREPPLSILHGAAERSINDFLLAGPPQPPHTLTWVTEVVFGMLAAGLTGALAGTDQLRGADQQRARGMTAKGRDLFVRCCASLPPAEQEVIERISLRLHELPRDETMDVLEREHGVPHFHAMMALGQAIAQRVPSPFPVPPSR